MKEYSIFIIIILLITILVTLMNTQQAFKSNKRNFSTKYSNNIYKKKNLMINYERYFYNILIELENELNVRIQPQVNLATILDKENKSRYINELFRNIDFGVFSKDYQDLILLIEINDKTHHAKARIRRDKKVEAILKSAGIPLLKFHSDYPNRTYYVKNRVKEAILNNQIK